MRIAAGKHRVVSAAILLLLLVPAGSALSQSRPIHAGTQRYLIATRQPSSSSRFRSDVSEGSDGRQFRNVAAFRSFDGFAADLDPAEVRTLRGSMDVRWIEPIVERHAFEITRVRAAGPDALTGSAQTIPRGIELVGAPAAWSARLTGEVNVVVVDTGVDFLHPDLAPLWRGGENLIYPADEPLDDNGHGTHVAGTIAASNNHFGVVGVAGVAGVRLWGLKVLDVRGKWGTSEALIKAVDWTMNRRALDGGHWVMNMSLGGPDPSEAEREAFARAADAGIIIVASAGNESTPEVPAPVLYPAAYPEVIAAGALDATGGIAPFSNSGPELDLVAPGVGILSTVRRGTGYRQQIYGPAAIYHAQALTGSRRGSIQAEAIFCGLGKPEEIPSAVRGRVAVMRRGEIRFNEKARNAAEAGAIAVAIINNEETSMTSWSLIPDDDPEAKAYDWPITLGLSPADGEALLSTLPGEVTMVWQPNDDYDDATGTSMAAPHITGAIALLWAIAPSASAQTIITSLRSTALDLGPVGVDPLFGAGLIDVNAAAHQLAPAAFIPSPDPPRPSTGRRIFPRGRR